MSAPRIKDATFLQQHIEKLILLAGVGVFAIAVFLFVLGNPFAIEVDRRAYDKPAEAVEVLERNRRQVELGLQDSEPLPEVEPPLFWEDFQATINREVDGRVVAGLGSFGTTRDALYPPPVDPSRYALAFPPVPKNITFKNGTDVLDKEFDVKIAKAFFDLWGKEMDEPGDFTMFVAAGEFDVSEWVNRLKADPSSDDDAIKIPPGIWVQRFGIAGVALLREEWDPEEGLWVNRQIVVPLPGQTRVLPEDKLEADTALALAEITRLREAQLELAQPELPWLIDFVQVAPPGGEEDGEGVGGFLQAVNDEKLGPAEKEIIKLEEKIEQLRERQAKQRERENRGGGARPGERPGDFDAPSPRSERRDPITRQIENLQEKIERLRPKAQEEEKNRKRLEELERQRDEERRRRAELQAQQNRNLVGPGQGFEGVGIEGLALGEDATLRVWAADPSMQPGTTYRYKLLVSVINPLYAVPRLAKDQLEENQHRAALLPTDAEIDAMPWIGPVKVEPEIRFFFVNGRNNGARIEIFRRVNGELRIQDFDGAPGDVIGELLEVQGPLGQPQQIDMTVDAIIVDVERRRDVFSGRDIYNLIYMDGEGNIHVRTDDSDKSSPVRKDNLDEIENGPDQVLRPAVDEINPGREEFGPGGPGFPAF